MTATKTDAVEDRGGRQRLQPRRVHLVYPHEDRTSQPDAIGRQLGRRLEESYEVVYHDWWRRGVIHPEPGDVLLGHPHPTRGTIFRRSARERGWSRVLMLGPYHHGDLRQNAFVDSIIRDCDLFLAITGPYWFGTIEASSCAHWRPKMVHVDMAVERAHFPPVKGTFSEPGHRRFVYIGTTAYMKNTPYLGAIAREMQGVDFAWIGRGASGIQGLRPLGFLDFDSPDGQRLLATFDFMLTVGRADANPTTILEAMAWGLIPVCTPQSGYAGVPGIANVPLGDAAEAATILRRLNEAPEEELLETQAANWRALDTHYNWDRFARQVVEAIESDRSPALGEEPFNRHLQFAWAALTSQHGTIQGARRQAGRGLRFVARKAGRRP